MTLARKTASNLVGREITEDTTGWRGFDTEIGFCFWTSLGRRRVPMERKEGVAVLILMNPTHASPPHYHPRALALISKQLPTPTSSWKRGYFK